MQTLEDMEEMFKSWWKWLQAESTNRGRNTITKSTISCKNQQEQKKIQTRKTNVETQKAEEQFCFYKQRVV